MSLKESSARFDIILIEMHYAVEDLIQDRLTEAHPVEPAGLLRLRARIDAARTAVDVVEATARRLIVELAQVEA